MGAHYTYSEMQFQHERLKFNQFLRYHKQKSEIKFILFENNNLEALCEKVINKVIHSKNNFLL